MRNARGFTLIELLVVIGIISAMMVWLVPQIMSGQATVYEVNCQKNLQNLYQATQVYKTRKKGRLPTESGITFFWRLWRSNAIENTDTGRRLLFCPEVVNVEPPPALEVPVDDIKSQLWRNKEDFDSYQTHYAARARAHRRTMNTENAIWFADDNEGARNHARGVINVLYSGGAPGSLEVDMLEEKGYWQGEPGDQTYVFPVGESSPHPELQKLTPLPDEG